MLWAFKQLTVPVRYLRIRHGTGLLHSKKFIDWVMPIALASLTLISFWWLGLSFSLYSHPALVKSLSNLLALMIVFYMAALAAVATFERKGIDDPLPDHDAVLKVKNPDGGASRNVVLSYRQFISYLFGYLSFLSLCLYMAIVIFDVGWSKFEKYFSGSKCVSWAFTHAINPIILFLVFFSVWQLFITSLLGIYFLTERIQTLNGIGRQCGNGS